MAYPSIAEINLGLMTSVIAEENIATPLLLAVHRNTHERVTEYNDPSSVAEDFSTDSFVYRSATGFFSQSPRPSSIKIGRIEADVSLAVDGVVQGGTDYGVQISVNRSTTDTVTVVASTEDTQEDIVDNLVTALNARYSVNITASKEGTGVNAVLVISPVLASDSFVIKQSIGMAETVFATESSVQAYEACKDEDEDFYFVASQLKNEVEVMPLVSAVNADKRFFAISLYEPASFTPLTDSPTDLAGKLRNLNYDNVFTFVHQTATEFASELSVIGRFATREPGTADWYAKVIAGIGATLSPATGKRITSTQQNYLNARNANAIVTEGGQDVFKMGKTSSGQSIDIVWFRDFYAGKLKGGYQSWRINNEKIPYDQAGIDSAESVFKSVTDRYVSTPQRPHAVQSYETRFPRREDVSFNDVASGVLRAQATIYLSGSILTVILDGTLTFDAGF